MSTVESPHRPDPFAATGRTLGWGIVSTGSIARKVTPEIAGLADARLVAVSSRRRESAEEFAREFGVARAYGDQPQIHDDAAPAASRAGASGTGLAQLLADDEVEVVYIATPHGQHHEHITAALTAGKHVVCEKAFTLNAAQAREVTELAREKGLFLMEGLWTRFQPLRARVAELLGAGAVGTPRWVQADLGFPAPADPQHRLWRQDAGGGALLDLGCYILHWPWLALGSPGRLPEDLTVHSIPRGPVDALTSITARFGGQNDAAAVAQMTGSLLSAGPRRAIISGEEGFLSIDGPLHRAQSFTLTDPSGTEHTEQWPLDGMGYVYEMREATRCIQQGLTESPTMPWADTVAQMEFFDRVRQRIGLAYPGLE